MESRRRYRSEGAQKSLDKDHYRTVVMGAAGVGKTCIVSQFMHETFVPEYKATVEDLHRKKFEIRGKSFTLDILDTSGAYPFPAMRKLAISTGDAFILVCSIDDEQSFDEVKTIRQQILDQREKEEHGEDGARTPIVIVTNKTDLGDESRFLHKETIESTACVDWNNGYVEVSAKENTNIVSIFRELLVQANADFPSSESKTTSKHKKLTKTNSCAIS